MNAFSDTTQNVMTQTAVTLEELIRQTGSRARVAARTLARAGSEAKNQALVAIARGLRANAEVVFEANRRDVERAIARGLTPAFIDRLTIESKTLEAMAQGCLDIARLADPVGEIVGMHTLPNGMQLGRMRVPLGVLGMIYESRPNVTVDAAALAIKSGNAVLLRGGSEAFESNAVLGRIVRSALEEAGLPADCVQTAPTADRDFVGAMITAKGLIDVIIPRGGKSLIARLEAQATIPMIHHLDGICTTYVDKDADLEIALKVTDNAKTQRYSPCNATENLLVHSAVAEAFLPRIGRIFADKHVQMRCDERARRILQEVGIETRAADPADWGTEYNAPIIAIAVVDTFDEAVDFITRYGSGHTDAIMTENLSTARRFLREVDSSSVMVNTSTRLADGFEYGLGAEIGISTGKLHARGPVGLEGLTNLKYIVLGNGQIRI